MRDTSPILALPYILPAQAQKHVTHNEALRHLDAIVQLVVISADRVTPPSTALPGDRYIVGLGSSGAWAGQDGMIAVADGSGWAFYGALSGWRADDLSSNRQIRFDGTTWITIPQGLEGQTQLGIGTSADAINRLAVAGAATLLTHDGGGHQLKINKAIPQETASLLFQSNWSGRAEMGLSGSDDFSIKVAADGATFTTALAVDRQSGAVRAPANPAFSAIGTGALRTINTDQTDLVFDTLQVNRGGAFDIATGRFTAPVDGFYAFLLNGILGNTTDATLCFAINGQPQGSQSLHVQGDVPLSFTAAFMLATGDTVTCRTGNMAGALVYDPAQAVFSGWLIS